MPFGNFTEGHKTAELGLRAVGRNCPVLVSISPSQNSALQRGSCHLSSDTFKKELELGGGLRMRKAECKGRLKGCWYREKGGDNCVQSKEQLQMMCCVPALNSCTVHPRVQCSVKRRGRRVSKEDWTEAMFRKEEERHFYVI